MVLGEDERRWQQEKKNCEPVDGILSRLASLLAAHGEHTSRRNMVSLGPDRLTPARLDKDSGGVSLVAKLTEG